MVPCPVAVRGSGGDAMSETPQERWRDRLNERLACSHFCLKHSGPCGECELREDIRALLVARAEEESRRLQLEGMNESRLDLIHRLKRVVTERALEVEEQAVLTQREREIAKAAEAERDALRAERQQDIFRLERLRAGAFARAERAEAALRYIVQRGYAGASWVAQQALDGKDWRDSDEIARAPEERHWQDDAEPQPDRAQAAYQAERARVAEGTVGGVSTLSPWRKP